MIHMIGASESDEYSTPEKNVTFINYAKTIKYPFYF